MTQDMFFLLIRFWALLGICYQLIGICPAGSLFAERKNFVKLPILIAAPLMLLIGKLGQMRPMFLISALLMRICPLTSSMEYLRVQCRKMSYPQVSFTNTSIVCGGAYNN